LNLKPRTPLPPYPLRLPIRHKVKERPLSAAEGNAEGSVGVPEEAEEGEGAQGGVDAGEGGADGFAGAADGTVEDRGIGDFVDGHEDGDTEARNRERSQARM